MKVLITGGTAPQASPKHAQRTPTFASLLARSFQDAGVETLHTEPSLDFTEEKLKQYDLVIVGITAPASVTANKIYPAFIMANRAKNLGNLALMLDAPDSFKILPSLRAAYNNPENLFKSFYDRRKNYYDVVDDLNLKAEIQSFVTYLIEESWPTTFYPELPWSTESFLKYLPNLSSDRAVSVSVDMHLILRAGSSPNFYSKKNYWTCDSLKSEDGINLSKMLTNSVVATRATKWEPEVDTLERIRDSIGTLIATHRNREPWWSPALAQSLSQGVPVVHDWRLTSYLGKEWSYLATNIEDMSESERFDIAYQQKQSYLSQLPDVDITNQKLINTISQTVY